MTKDNNDPLDKALNLAPMSTDIVVKEVMAKSQDDSAKADFNMARSNIHEIIQTGTQAIDRLLMIAEQSQHPRAFEVLATLMKVQLDANKALLDNQKDIRDIEAADEPHNEDAKAVTNNLFVGSTAELQSMIESMKNGTSN
jgi:Terminase DNA packaging enzyme